MAIQVGLENNTVDLPTANDVLHVTVGTANPRILPVESNVLLVDWLTGGGAVGVVNSKGMQALALSGNGTVVSGTVSAF